MKNSNFYRNCLLLVFILIGAETQAQQLDMDVRDFDGNIRIYDPANTTNLKGNLLSYAEVEGSPFWDDKYSPAIIYFNNGTKAKLNQARLNLYSNEIHYINGVGTELAVENEGINRLVFLNKNNLNQPLAIFVKLSNVLTSNGAHYYRVFNTGMYQLILLQQIVVKTSAYDPLQGKSISSFITKKDYAIYNDGKVIPLKSLNHANVIAATPNHAIIKETLGDNTKLNNEKEVIDYLEKVNSTINKVGNK